MGVESSELEGMRGSDTGGRGAAVWRHNRMRSSCEAAGTSPQEPLTGIQTAVEYHCRPRPSPAPLPVQIEDRQ